jgi:predicted Zn-dependent peptidase
MAVLLEGARSSRQTHLLWLVALLGFGCGAGAVQHRVVEPRELGLVRRGADGGPDLAVITRPSGGIAQLSLFIDAGSRDADPPQVATLAAWLSAKAAGADVEGRVWPDGVELALACHTSELAACVAKLARGLALRQVKPAELALAQKRLTQARRESEAADPKRGADRLALQALYGETARGFVPLGRAQDDSQLTAGQVNSFLAQHMGRGRLLLVAAGDLDTDVLAKAAGAFSRVPRATHARAQRSAAPSDEGGVRVGVEDQGALSLALAAPDLGQAQTVAAALQARLERDALALKVSGHVFAVRGAALALLRVDTHEPLLVVRAAAHELERLRREGVAQGVAQANSERLIELTRRFGARWIAGEPPRSQGLALGIGLVVEGGRGDRLHVQDPDTELHASWQERATSAWKEGLALGEPHVTGQSDDQTASLVLDNGAHIELRRRASEPLVVAVRFGRGADADPPPLYSRAALLATLAATTCGGTLPRQLGARLRELGARLEPRVDPESWGLLLTAPEKTWQASLSLALDCALHPTLERQELAAARLALKERLGAALGEGELRAAAAEVFSPSAPGEIAPWGSPSRQAAVSLAALRELWAQSRRGPSVAVSAVGPLPLQETAAFIARRLSDLSAKPAASASPSRPPAANAMGETPKISQPTLGLALFRVQMTGADPAGAQAFIAVMRAELGAGGITASWHDAGVTTDSGWAVLALSGPADQLAAVSARLHETASSVPGASLERAADQAFELLQRSRASDEGSATAEAETLARAPFSPPRAGSTRETARALALRLAQAEPIWLPIR